MAKVTKENILFDYIKAIKEQDDRAASLAAKNRENLSKIFMSLEAKDPLAEPGWGQVYAKVAWTAGKP